MHPQHDIFAAPSCGATGGAREGTTHPFRTLAGALLALAVAFCVAAAPTGAALAAGITASAETEVALGFDLAPLVLKSLTGNGEVLYVQAGGSIALAAEFEGGEGDTAFTWEESRDGGNTFALVATTRGQLPAEQTSAEARRSAQPAAFRPGGSAPTLQTADGAATASSTYTVTDARAPECGYLVYRLYAYDDSIQRVPAMFTVYVTDEPGPTPDPDPPGPKPTPTPTPSPTPSGGGGQGGIFAKTGDAANAAAFLMALASAGIALYITSRKARRWEEEQQ